ncbi:GNAT family N-acetyltransferase [Mesorhizobium sp. M0924]
MGFGFLAHGYAKLSRGPGSFGVVLQTLGVPEPQALAWLTTLVELIGGGAVLAGAFIPLVSVPMAIVLLTALFTVHSQYGFFSVKFAEVKAEGIRFGPVGYEIILLYLAGLSFVIRDAVGRIVGVATGFSWAGTSELKQMWIDEAHRGRGYARALLNAFSAEAKARGVRRIWVQSHNFQAPGMYEKFGFVRVAEFANWPEGHSNVILCKTLEDPTATQ